MLQKILGLPIDVSAQGPSIDRLIAYMHLLMLVLFVGWTAFFIYTLIRFRRSRHPRADHEGVKTHASSYLEGFVAVLEIALLVGLSIPFWARKVGAFPSDAQNPLHVRVIAQQFAWNIQYPGPDGKFGRTELKLVSDDNSIGLDRKDPSGKDDVVELNQLYVPVNRPVVIDITSKDVIHSFFLPFLRVKQDAIPGMSIPIYFTPTMTSEQVRQREIQTTKLPSELNLDLYATMQDYSDKDGNVLVKKGSLLTARAVKKLMDNGIAEITVAPYYPIEIACAQLCGLNHYRMKGFLNVLSEKDFEKWYADEVESQKEE